MGIVVPRVAHRQIRACRSGATHTSAALGPSWNCLAVLAGYRLCRGHQASRTVDRARASDDMSRNRYDAVGGWDESFFLSPEETDAACGHENWTPTSTEPRSVVVDVGGQSGGDRRTKSCRSYVSACNGAARSGDILALLGLTVASEISWLLRGHGHYWHAVIALLMPARRPPRIKCGRAPHAR